MFMEAKAWGTKELEAINQDLHDVHEKSAAEQEVRVEMQATPSLWTKTATRSTNSSRPLPPQLQDCSFTIGSSPSIAVLSMDQMHQNAAHWPNSCSKK